MNAHAFFAALLKSQEVKSWQKKKLLAPRKTLINVTSQGYLLVMAKSRLFSFSNYIDLLNTASKASPCNTQSLLVTDFKDRPEWPFFTCTKHSHDSSKPYLYNSYGWLAHPYLLLVKSAWYLRQINLHKLPSGVLTLSFKIHKRGFSWKVQRRPRPADIFLNESLPLKIPLRTPCQWLPWAWFSRKTSLKIFTG